MGAEGVSLGVHIVLQQVDASILPGLGQAVIGLSGEVGEDLLPGAVLGDQLPPVIAFGGRVFGVGAHI